MTKYRVTADTGRKGFYQFDVEADSKEEARQTVVDMFNYEDERTKDLGNLYAIRNVREL